MANLFSDNPITRWFKDAQERSRACAEKQRAFEAEPRMAVPSLTTTYNFSSSERATTCVCTGFAHVNFPVLQKQLAQATVVPFAWDKLKTDEYGAGILGVHEYQLSDMRERLHACLSKKPGGGSIITLPRDTEYGAAGITGNGMYRHEPNGETILVSTLSAEDAHQLIVRAHLNMSRQSSRPAGPTALPPGSKAAPEFR